MTKKPISYNRHLKILDILAERQKIKVEDLSKILDVSPVTIRRDLDFLDSQKLLIRTHGGASVLQEWEDYLPERAFQEKVDLNKDYKSRIAHKAVEMLKDNDTIFVNSGTTTLSFISEINKKVHVITNNARAITNKVNPDIELMILGGEYREASQSLVGILTIENIQKINSNYTFLGVNGLYSDKGLMTSVLQECSVNNAMIKNTNDKIIVLADHSKIGRISNFVTAPCSVIDILITDELTSEEELSKFRDMGIEIIIA
ncbi:MAG: DeoR/GlpR family DNA-binding transcription regulator [Sphaerochaetaceae bacterium]|nr:DeoR/GlpR family DNA-binding transcription regulator [Sphaerochaetaceae bacterium]MDC7238537.1 DeoR/GlpR family DNA-binding transcription regulator [Sphaerochaetaceae bacterium]MDC7248817.1 DeoR/GlpR family DNA-binding transcription regulator [Sphaerochaetaceae bacterium]